MTTATPTPRAVLAYGTLRPGYGNHDLVADLVETTTPATVEGAAMLVPDHGWFPYAVRAEGSTIQGEVLRFGEGDWREAIRRMDRLEGHPSHYRRQVVETTDGEAVWLYVAADWPRAAWHLPSGDWTDVAGTRQSVR